MPLALRRAPAFGHYLQYFKDIQPCPLCIIPRLLLAWTFLTLSIPEWTLIAFVGFAVYAVYLSFKD